MWSRALIVWLLLLMAALANGGFREAVLTPGLGLPVAHVISTLLLSTTIVALTWLLTPWMHLRTVSDGVLVGMVWAGLVLAFEFLAGHFLFGRSWPYLVADYDVSRGRIWILVPLVTLFAPAWARRVRVPRA
jgi:hypothetical protein